MRTNKTVWQCDACGTKSDHGGGWITVQLGWHVGAGYGDKVLSVDLCGWNCVRAWAENPPQSYVDFRRYTGLPESTPAVTP